MTVAANVRARFGQQPLGNIGPVPISTLLRFGAAVATAMAAFSVILLLDGTNPLDTIQLMWDAAVGTEFGRTEVMVKLIPFGLCALAVAIPHAKRGLDAQRSPSPAYTAIAQCADGKQLVIGSSR